MQRKNHRRTLSRNVEKVGRATRPSKSCAHHIVALSDPEAYRSRLRVFEHGIGINDGDNGVHLPRHRVGLPGHPNAAYHNPYHRPTYHRQVFLRLLTAETEGEHRAVLRRVKADLLEGRMSL